MISHRITLLPGDGIGPEITAVACQMLEAVSRRHGFGLAFDEQPIGGAAIDAT
ncbi:MAG: isocitrate/isopropylmalate family dehydrogenase, partial [Cyanobacteriota bacterium]